MRECDCQRAQPTIELRREIIEPGPPAREQARESEDEPCPPDDFLAALPRALYPPGDDRRWVFLRNPVVRGL